MSPTAGAGTKVLVLGSSSSPGHLMPYGVEHLVDLGYEVVQAPRRAVGLAGKVRDVVEHRSGLLVEEWVRGWRTRPDIVLPLLDREAEVVVRTRGRFFDPYRRAKLVVLLCWAAEWMSHMAPAERARSAQRLNRADVLLVLSHNQVAMLREFGVDRPEIHAVPFGVATSYYTPGGAPAGAAVREGLVAFGVDGGRDYATLCDAVAGTGIEVDLYCAEWNLEGFDLPAEVRWRGTVPHEEYREALRSCRAVVVPTHERAYPTGQSVAMEGAACGALVVTTSTVALGEYFRHDDTALMSPPGDAAGLRANLERVVRGDDWRAVALRGHDHIRAHHDTTAMWDAVAAHL